MGRHAPVSRCVRSSVDGAKHVAIVGTVSRVEVDPNGSPQWVTIYFKESPDAMFVVCSPYPDCSRRRSG